MNSSCAGSTTERVLYLLLSVAVMAVTILGTTLFMMWLSERSANASLTERFKDAETVVNEGRVPASWLGRSSLFGAFMQGRLGRAFAPQGADKTRLLERLDDLILFFETCPFFDSEASRDALLDALWLERDRWEADLPGVETQ